MSTELMHVEFAGAQLECIQDENGDVWVGVKRACVNMGAGYSSQAEKLKDVATVRRIRTVALDGKQRKMLMIHINSLAWWLSSIGVNKVKPEARPTLIKYQKECAEVLNAHFFGGGSGKGISDQQLSQMESRLEDKIVNMMQRILVTQAQSQAQPQAQPGQITYLTDCPDSFKDKLAYYIQHDSEKSLAGWGMVYDTVLLVNKVDLRAQASASGMTTRQWAIKAGYEEILWRTAVALFEGDNQARRRMRANKTGVGQFIIDADDPKLLN